MSSIFFAFSLKKWNSVLIIFDLYLLVVTLPDEQKDGNVCEKWSKLMPNKAINLEASVGAFEGCRRKCFCLGFLPITNARILDGWIEINLWGLTDIESNNPAWILSTMKGQMVIWFTLLFARFNLKL